MDKQADIEIQINNAAAQAELGEAYNLNAKGDSAPMRASFHTKSGSKGSFDFKESLKGGILTTKYIIHGGNSVFQKAYKENSYLKQNVADLKKRVEGMDEKDKAWEVAVWLSERVCYDYYEVDQSAEAVYKKKAYGACSALADMYYRYAVLAGVEKPGKVLSKEDQHDWNCVKIDGETYYLDMQCIDTLNGDYDFVVENADNPDKEKWVELRRQVIKDYNCGLSDPTEVSKGEFCLLNEEQFLNYTEEHGKPSQWIYAGNFAKYFY